jgi:hypothetical protein
MLLTVCPLICCWLSAPWYAADCLPLDMLLTVCPWYAAHCLPLDMLLTVCLPLDMLLTVCPLISCWLSAPGYAADCVPFDMLLTVCPLICCSLSAPRYAADCLPLDMLLTVWWNMPDFKIILGFPGLPRMFFRKMPDFFFERLKLDQLKKIGLFCKMPHFFAKSPTFSTKTAYLAFLLSRGRECELIDYYLSWRSNLAQLAYIFTLSKVIF